MKMDLFSQPSVLADHCQELPV